MTEDEEFEAMWEIANIFNDCRGDKRDLFNKAHLISIKQFLRRLPMADVVDAAEAAASRIDMPDHRSFRYFCGICWRKIGDQKQD